MLRRARPPSWRGRWPSWSPSGMRAVVALRHAQSASENTLAAAQRDCEALTHRAEEQARRAEEEAKRVADAEAELVAIREDPLKDLDVMGDLAYYLAFAEAIHDMKKVGLLTAPWRSP